MYHNNLPSQKLDSVFPFLPSGVKSFRQEREERAEPLRSLKPYILDNWVSLLEMRASEQALPYNVFERSNLSAALDNVFRILGYLGDDSDTPELPPMRLGNIPLGETVNCKVGEPFCLALFETCLEAFESAISVFHPLRLNGQNMGERELEDLVELAIRAMIHLEMNACAQGCDVENCPFAYADTQEFAARMDRMIG